MSHRYPRLISNGARTTFVNSMHGLRLRPEAPPIAREALPIFMFNSVTMLGAEVQGRSYGGGILKMEPREAASLPMPRPDDLTKAWTDLKSRVSRLQRNLRNDQWTNVVKTVDEVLLVETRGAVSRRSARTSATRPGHSDAAGWASQATRILSPRQPRRDLS